VTRGGRALYFACNLIFHFKSIVYLFTSVTGPIQWARSFSRAPHVNGPVRVGARQLKPSTAARPSLVSNDLKKKRGAARKTV